ncbi:MAG: MMPL family transporter [Deltaproteobacteria bacterium]|nr:MMPL family transporter [Deltaproteobacteria bacterium]
MLRRPEQLARRYVAWLRSRSLLVIAAYLAVTGGAMYLIAFHLPLRADFSYLLPQDAASVQDLRRLEARVKANDAVLVLVDAPDAATQQAVTKQMVEGARKITKELVERVEHDDSDVRAFFKARRHLFVPLADLQAAHDALDKLMKRAKLKANPLYIDLDDPDPKAEARTKQQLAELQAKARAAEAQLDKPANVSADGKIALIQVRTLFRSTDAGRGRELLDALDLIRQDIAKTYPAAKIGFAGGVVTAVAEHDAIFKGMVMSGLITTLLVGIVLVLYFRSATLLVLLIGTLGLATVMSFGFAAITVGHLNAATAFLGAIIAGNGVNYGILLVARYLEERRRHDVDAAMAVAIAGTLRPTVIATLGASIAYGSLAATSFKGFADFAMIGAIGMMVCWIATYMLLPALVLRFGRSTRIYTGDPIVGSTLVRILGFRRSGVVCVIAAVLGVIASIIVVRYIAADPFEYNIRNLRSEGSIAVESREWMQLSDRTFGRGISSRTYIAADRLDQVPKIVTALKDHENGVPEDLQTFGAVHSILDAVPAEQPQKLEVLAKIRTLLDDDTLQALDDKERADLLALRPPDDLVPITAEQLPGDLRDRLTEKDGRIGYLVAIRPANRLDEWNGHDLIRFADAVRKIDLSDGETVTTSGASVIFADIVTSIERDGPLVTGVASLGLVIMVVLLVGFNRSSFAVLIGTGSGTLLMIAVCALLGIRVNFLDFIALPITLGLGIDYAINIAHRQHNDEMPDPITTLRTSGSAVFVCSLTTIIGYGSLLVSDNLAIRGFGTASLIGEIACVFTALVLVPAILAIGHKRRL